MFTQDKNDDFDWTRHSAATRDTKYTPNTGPSDDRSGSKQGEPTRKEDTAMYCFDVIGILGALCLGIFTATKKVIR